MKHQLINSIPIGSMVLLYMETFTINIPQMLAYIPYMDPMGYSEGSEAVEGTSRSLAGWCRVIAFATHQHRLANACKCNEHLRFSSQDNNFPWRYRLWEVLPKNSPCSWDYPLLRSVCGGLWREAVEYTTRTADKTVKDRKLGLSRHAMN